MTSEPVSSAPTPPIDPSMRRGISVFMPILNEEKHLEEAVTAILAQRYDGPVEVVLAIGPCTDRTWDVARALGTRRAGRAAGVIRVRHPPRVGGRFRDWADIAFARRVSTSVMEGASA